MAWVRLDDKVMSNPKIYRLSDKAFRLWIWGLCYTQMHLTDGYLPPDVPVPSRLKRALPDLIRAELWRADEDGAVQIHDYLQWNDPKALVVSRRQEAKERMARVREERSREQVSERSRVATSEVLRGVVDLGSGSLELPEKGSGEKPSEARSKRPIFSGQRLTVFEWQLDNCVKLLGEHTDAFDIHSWFYELDALAVARGQVLPKRDGGAWLEAQLVTEAQRRGLPLQMAAMEPTNKRIAGLATGGQAFLNRNRR